MIRVFGPTDRNYSSNGDAVLRPIKCKVHKEDNGDYYLDLETGLEYLDYIVTGNIIVAPTPQGPQPFRVSNPTKTRSKITAKCKHVYYDGDNYLIVLCQVRNLPLSSAIGIFNQFTSPTSEFTVSSNITSTGSYTATRQPLTTVISELIKVWGGHLVRDGFTFAINSSIGADNGVTVRYRKNLKEITCTENWDNVVTKLCPVGQNDIMLNAINPSDSVYLVSSTQYDTAYVKAVSFDQSNIKEEDYKDSDGDTDEDAYLAALVADLRAKGQAYLAENCVPQVNYTLKANLEKITDIGDTIHVYDERLGLNLLANVIKFDYDCLTGRYTEIEFGNFRQTLSGLIPGITSRTASLVSRSAASTTAALSAEIAQTQSQIMTDLARQVMTRSLSSDVSSLTAGSWVILNLDQTQYTGDKLSATADGGIKIGDGVTKVIISGSVSCTAVTAGLREIRIVKNSATDANTIGLSEMTIAADGTAQAVISRVLADVTKDDIIRLCIKSPYATDTVNGDAYGARTSLTVEVI